jgi:hypothetical protein
MQVCFASPLLTDFDSSLMATEVALVAKPAWYRPFSFEPSDLVDEVLEGGFMGVCYKLVRRLTSSKLDWVRGVDFSLITGLLQIPGRPVTPLRTRIRREFG